MNKSLCKTDCFSDQNSRRIPMQSVKFRPEKLKNTRASSYKHTLCFSGYWLQCSLTFPVAILQIASEFFENSGRKSSRFYIHTYCALCCKCLGSLACLQCKMPMFQRVGMRPGGRVATPTSISIFYSYDLNLVMMASKGQHFKLRLRGL